MQAGTLQGTRSLHAEVGRQGAFEGPGLVLVGGAAGSGRGMTLASLVDTVQRERRAFVLAGLRSLEFAIEPDQAVVQVLQVGVDVTTHKQALAVAVNAGADVVALDDAMKELEALKQRVSGEPKSE